MILKNKTYSAIAEFETVVSFDNDTKTQAQSTMLKVLAMFKERIKIQCSCP